jgi:Haem-binding domain
MKKYVRPLLYGLLALLIVAQFYRPARNLSNDQTNHVSTKYPFPAEVETILKSSCYDCHSNQTTYPWYAEIQPVAAWLANHVAEGKRELNFSEFTKRRVAVQNHKFEEIMDNVKEGEMPLNSYTWIHRNAALSAQQRETIVSWAQTNMDSLKVQYPADSLVLRPKPR